MSALRPDARTARVLRSRSTAAATLGELTAGCRVVGVTRGQFSLLDLIEACLVKTGPAEVLVSTWTPGIAEMERVLRLLETGLVSGFQLLVDRSFPGRHPKYVARVTEICGLGAIRKTRTHAKFALIHSGGYWITIRTSMNFNTNPRLEQFDLDDDPAIYELFAGVAQELFEDVGPGLAAPEVEVQRGFRNLQFDLGMPTTADDLNAAFRR